MQLIVTILRSAVDDLTRNREVSRNLKIKEVIRCSRPSRIKPLQLLSTVQEGKNRSDSLGKGSWWKIPPSLPSLLWLWLRRSR